MSKTNQICITCTQRDTCQYYGPNRTHCVPVMTEQEMQFELMKSQEEVNALRQEVSSMNKEREYWQQVRIQAAIAAMNIVKGAYNIHDDIERLVRHSVKLADALIEELQKKGDNNG